MPDLQDVERRVVRLDREIQPILDQPLDVRSPQERVQRMMTGPPLIDQDTVVHGEMLLRALLAHYADGDDATRVTIRRILRDNQSFLWAAHVPWEATTGGVRLQVLWLSARDGGMDMRDEIVSLDHLCTRAGNAGIEIAPILREVAELSGDEDRQGMGSMKELLLSRAHRYAD
ncbi:MAG TPA: hypothetical protein VH969_11955 [Actinophytocola sp.]|jgi:hypothetical protein|uniref:hypothetical protein n=1 Tax=Actinophytocola sp. TaxID=1872138 RepID=UPI002F93E660